MNNPRSGKRLWTGAFFLLISISFLFSCLKHSSINDNPRVLIFSKTKGWKHTSIPFGIEAIQKLGKQHGFSVDTTKNAELFTDDNLKNYRAVIFLSTTGNILNPEQQASFERYIQAGGGYVGIHSAADTEYEWPWYAKLMGAHFSSHPHNPNVRKATIDVTNKNHPSTKILPDKWERTDEWYNYRSFYPGIHSLANLDENTYEGGTNGSNHPIAWFHEFDGGRAFYTGGGHEDSSFSEPLFLDHILGGIQYAMGKGELDYSKSYAVVTPEENRFVKTVLINDLNTPMELAMSADGRIFYTELRTANLYMYNTVTGKNSLVHRFDVSIKGGTGLIGVALDPHFNENNYIYVYYAPPSDQEPFIFNLSRFTLKQDNTLDLASEKILLKVPVQEKSGSHHGGSLAWDKDGNLYLSTGDSSSPFPANGYAPIDERPGDEFYSLDAQRSSSNTNDLKGKILRIHPEPDGTYTIPEGNLFPPGTEKTLPEIYVMGCRNPYRIAVNPETSVLYWGEIGPDAGKDSIQGPKGYDEFNQAKKAGNYGWPYFVGNNEAYAEWNFATNTAGPRYNAEKPVNNSPNNTGLTNLPPANAPFIWYPYAYSEEFPELGLGGRSAMVGDFYTFNANSTAENNFPKYYDGSLFVFDWMRNWVMAVRFDEKENYVRSEPFMMANGDFRRPIDLTFSKDGVMYMLEYGSVYGADNEDARLVKIEYNTGNRAPVAKAGILGDPKEIEAWDKKVFLTSERSFPQLEEITGNIPLEVAFSARHSKDPDGEDHLTYQWLFDGQTIGSKSPSSSFTYTKPGEYKVILKVTDQKGLTGMDTVLVKAGNSMPEVTILTPNNKSFYWENKPFSYSVKVNDKEDNPVHPKEVKIRFDYNPSPGSMVTQESVKLPLYQKEEFQPLGYTLIAGSDCKACHTIDKVSVGPSYLSVSQRYKGQEDAISLLTKKVIAGGGGNWGEHVMSAHPQIPAKDVKEMVKYILSLSQEKKQKKMLAPQGTLALEQHEADEPRGIYTLTASYTDKGNSGIGPITNGETVILRNAKVRTIDADTYVGMERWGDNIGSANHKSHILLKNVDLTGIKSFTYEYSSQNKEGEIEVRIDSYAGPVIAKTSYKATGDWDKVQAVSSQVVQPVSGRHNVYFILLKREKPNDDIIKLMSIEFGE